MSLIDLNITIEEEILLKNFTHPQNDKIDFRDINYKTELVTGIKLHPVFTFGITGLLEQTIYYKDYIDDNDKGEEVLKAEITWVIDNDETIPSAKSIISRETKRSWMNKEGNYSSKTKISPKKYDTKDKKNDAGSRMRLNLRRDAEYKIGTALFFADISTNGGNTLNPTDVMTNFLEHYTKAFYTWHITGKGTLYDDIQNDSETFHNWLNWIIPDTPETQALIPDSIGMTIRAYSVDKFKGLIN